MRLPLTPMKVAFFTPYLREPRGNATTARRLIAGMKQHGISVEIFVYEEDAFTASVQKRLEECDLVHILHFGRFALWMERVNFRLTKPYIITSGGTDINHDLLIEERSEKLKKFLVQAKAVTVFTKEGKERLEKAVPAISSSVFVIPSSYWLPTDPLKNQPRILQGTFPQVLLPAGLRRVKDVLYLLPALKRLRETHFPSLTFSIVGTIIDREVYEEVVKASTRFQWVRFYGEVPLEKMMQVYTEADVVVNSSLSEGQSGAIVEALSLRRPVLARKIPGNESLIVDRENGFLFETIEEFSKKFVELFHDERLHDRLVRNGEISINRKHSFDHEMKSYIKLYQNVIGIK